METVKSKNGKFGGKMLRVTIGGALLSAATLTYTSPISKSHLEYERQLLSMDEKAQTKLVMHDPKETDLEILSKSSYEMVRHLVAVSFALTNTETLANLANDPCDMVRWHVAWNEHTKTETDIYLLKDKVDYVRERAEKTLMERAEDTETSTDDLFLILKSHDTNLDTKIAAIDTLYLRGIDIVYPSLRQQ